MQLANRRILLGITGSIAAYKGAELIRGLRAQGAEVQVVLTRGGAAFITPLTLQALSGRSVHANHLDAISESAMGHIDLARWSDLILIAPASANCIARLASGMADDLLTTICLVSQVPLAIAPAMNRLMWEHPATQENLARLRARGVQIFGPASGEQACGEIGPGRMLEPSELLDLTARFFAQGRLAGRSVLITGGPTREAIDPVRFISNRSSGRMAYALAAAAVKEGARVVLVSGPVDLEAPRGVERIFVESAAQMHDAIAARAPESDIFIAAAAVADYRPVAPALSKIKKDASNRQLELERTPDILAEVAAKHSARFIVGFAAETENLETNALHKLKEKRLDMVIANRVGLPDRGFDSADNEALVLWPEGGRRELPLARKESLAAELMAIIAERYDAKSQTENR
ncbi:MAG: bifunctional phosphopantothenoylcysteine decarboxylase/phosphopantothenate--cysteine ligase CoaBC [Chromatiales bacterium]|jgi:phosphopantothenoylcysteine decarboxylase/phosphopantothenate--cysteine ligase|nr:bifunctional phosphopantothenoylcysteine decarboxylase/phosphopantothenate--cysteine ligase CoaBC [Chromatiales bacterium]